MPSLYVVLASCGTKMFWSSSLSIVDPMVLLSLSRIVRSVSALFFCSILIRASVELRNVKVIEAVAGWFPALIAEVKTEIGSVQFLNVHLKPPFTDSGSVTVSAYYESPDVHRKELSHFLKAADLNAPLIIAGDFNENERSEAIRNLLNNALKYRKTQVELSLEESDGSLLIRVRDDGEGIPSAYHKKIFECYFQMDSERDHCVRGHGLGLAGVMVLVEDMGGELFLESDRGKGASFMVKVPLDSS